MLTLKDIVAATGLRPWQVRYRLRQLHIRPQRVHDRLFLWPPESIDAVKNWQGEIHGD